MQLDNTCIAIRERNLLETLDLSFRLLREFWKPWLICSLLAIIPLALINALLVSWMASDIDFSEEPPFRYFWLTAVFIYTEAPLASVFVIAYLGPAVFMENPKIKKVVFDALKQWPALILCQLILRGILPLWLLALTFDRYSPNYWVEVGLLGFVFVPYVTVLRAFRPYINEIIVLEKNPLRSSNPHVITIGKRSSHLHSPYSGDLFVRWLGTMLATVILISVIGVTTYTLQATLFNTWGEMNWFIVYFWYPGILWAVVALISVVRFLDYLDLRIRHEGWEVELLMKAEALRLKPTVI
jgi:hypothetical protein